MINSSDFWIISIIAWHEDLIFQHSDHVVSQISDNLFAEHFSGPGKAIGPVRVCVRPITFALNNLHRHHHHHQCVNFYYAYYKHAHRYLACWFIVTLYRSSSKVEVIGQSSWSQEEKMLLKWSVRPRVRAFQFCRWTARNVQTSSPFQSSLKTIRYEKSCLLALPSSSGIICTD